MVKPAECYLTKGSGCVRRSGRARLRDLSREEGGGKDLWLWSEDGRCRTAATLPETRRDRSEEEKPEEARIT